MRVSATSDLWWKNAVVYCLDVETYAGDVTGFIQRIDHIADLGASCVWLMPLYPTPNQDDGYDITDYLGYGDIVYVLQSPKATLTLTGRGNPATRKGAAQVELSYRPRGAPKDPLAFYFQLFTGYGESLIDYNWRQTTFGVGLSLNDIL